MDPDRRIAVWAVVLALVALTGLVPTFLATRSLRGEVHELTSAVRSLKDRLLVTELDQDTLEGSVAKEVENFRTELIDRMQDDLNASEVVDHINDAVFTVVSGNAQGSGFGFVSFHGETWIATNWHVIADSTSRDGPKVLIRHEFSQWRGTVERWDPFSDVALVKVNATLPVLTSAYEAGHPPAVGDSVLAYGSPLGLEGTATVGIISAFRVGFIQTDAQINHGNSGGPLVNVSGEVLGLTTSGYGDGSGLGFAVNIRTLCDELLRERC
jgi:S1-C subfamily serine protease